MSMKVFQVPISKSELPYRHYENPARGLSRLNYVARYEFVTDCTLYKASFKLNWNAIMEPRGSSFFNRPFTV